ncbi:hypothetical protein [Jannaschia sp. 2305UL9-9]|uniref:hypothetical protein n=1 Tax=Jannaschia sp. 2305UL9-9 TaxID=3121638 RepID=UPI003527BEF5
MCRNVPTALCAVVVCLSTAGCIRSDPDAGRPSVAVENPSPHVLTPAPDGLDVSASGGRQIGFGRDRPGVLQTVERITGQHPVDSECPAAGYDAVALRSGLILVFRGEAFVGWQTPDAKQADRAAAGQTCF